MIASLLALAALGIDGMLPALPAIAQSLHVPRPNDQQLIITAYMVGLGVSQLFYGTLADRFGRRPVLLTGIGFYILFSVVASEAQSLEIMLIARGFQGVGAAAARVLSISIVRDRYSGRRMAQVMSFSFIVFLAVPVLAPSIGQLELFVAPWPWLFRGYAAISGIVGLWVWWRLPETLHRDDRSPLSIQRIYSVFRLVLTNRTSIGYTLAMTLVFGSLLGFISCAQQLFADVFHEVKYFPVIFGIAAIAMAISSLLNSQIVGRLGMRVVSHIGLIGFITVAVVHLTVAYLGFETIWTFVIFQSAMLFCLGIVGPNFGSMSMESLGHVAGTASSIQGFISTFGGAIVGTLIGATFNGSVVPIILGFSVCSSTALIVVLITEKGRLFQSHNPAVG